VKSADEMTELGFATPIPSEFAWSELSGKISNPSILPIVLSG
jgi:hypothetical protein